MAVRNSGSLLRKKPTGSSKDSAETIGIDYRTTLVCLNARYGLAVADEEEPRLRKAIPIFNAGIHSYVSMRVAVSADRRCVKTVSHTPETPGEHRQLRAHLEVLRCSGN